DLVALIRRVVGGVDLEGLDVSQALRVVEHCAEAERVLAALRVLATATLKDKAVWRRQGFRSLAMWMAAQTGTAVGPATESLEMVDLLADLPVVADAFRGGRLSEAQAVEIADVAAEAPDVQEQ